MEPLKIFPLKILRSLTALSVFDTSREELAFHLLLDFFEKKGVGLAFLLKSMSEDGSSSLLVVFEHDPGEDFYREFEEVKGLVKAGAVQVDKPVAIIRVLGPHFDIRPGVAGLLLGNLLKAGIEVMALATTITSTMLVIPDRQVEETVGLLQRTFQLPDRC